MPLLSFEFANFTDLFSEHGKSYFSKKALDCDGRPWRLWIFLGGNGSGQENPSNRNDNKEEEVFVSLYLFNRGSPDVKASYSFIIRNANGQVAFRTTMSSGVFEGGGGGQSFPSFKERSFFLDKSNSILSHEGTLTIDVDIQTHADFEQYKVPPNLLNNNILQALETGENADVAFKINRKVVHAHKFILNVNAPILAEYCKGTTIKSPVKITDTSVEVFRLVLRYVYGGDLPSEEQVLESGMQIIEAADRYDIIGLKMAVESKLCACRAVDVTNVAEYILFAHSKNCPLLKEYATNYFVDRADDILESDHMGNLDESPELMRELMIKIVKSPKKRARESELQKKSVKELREMLFEKGLDMDGSKEVLISRLESESSSNKKQRSD